MLRPRPRQKVYVRPRRGPRPVRDQSRHLDIGYVPPTDTGSLCLAVDSTHTVVGLFRLLVRRSGTHCSQMNSEIRRVMSTASNSSLKQSCSVLLERLAHWRLILTLWALQIYVLLTYLLTYLLRVLTAVSDTETATHSLTAVRLSVLR